MNVIKKGFTLIELLIVIVILTLLGLMAFNMMKRQLLKARDAQRKSDINMIGKAAEEYEKDNNCYPDASLVVCDPGNGLDPYMKKIPCDPITGRSYSYITDDLSCHRWYYLAAEMESTGDYSYYSSPNAPLPSSISSPTPTSESSATPNPTPTPTQTAVPTAPPTYWGFWCCNRSNGLCYASNPGSCNPNYANKIMCEAVCEAE